MSTIVAKKKPELSSRILTKAYRLMFTARTMADLYQDNNEIYDLSFHDVATGHEAVQIALGLQLESYDFASISHQDEAMLVAMGITPHELMLQLLGKKEDPFSGGRINYCYPSLKREGMPTVPCQSSAVGMRAIQGTGMAHAVTYMEEQKLMKTHNPSIVLCSMGNGYVTDGEVSEAWQMALLKKLPIIYLVQDDQSGMPGARKKMGAIDTYEYAAIKGMERVSVDSSDFIGTYEEIKRVIAHVRNNKIPMLVYSKFPSPGQRTLGIGTKQNANDESSNHHADSDPVLKLKKHLLSAGAPEESVMEIESAVKNYVDSAFQKAVAAPPPNADTITLYEFAESPVIKRQGSKRPKAAVKVTMSEVALHAIEEILAKHPEAIFYGQDVSKELNGGILDALKLTKKYGKHRVFNTSTQQAYVIGSTVGMSAVGAKPIVETTGFTSDIGCGLSQLVGELSKSCYLSMGKFPVQALIRVPIGDIGEGDSYNMDSIDSALLNIPGIKVAYPSNSADLKGLMKAAYYDPNPVIMLEHRGLNSEKMLKNDGFGSFEPDDKYMIPLGLANKIMEAEKKKTEEGNSILIITYGMGVHRAKEAGKSMDGQVTILDLRTLSPLDWETIINEVKIHGKVLILTEEPLLNSFGESIAGRISGECFQFLDAPVQIMGAKSLPATVNVNLRHVMLPSADTVGEKLSELLAY